MVTAITIPEPVWISLLSSGNYEENQRRIRQSYVFNNLAWHALGKVWDSRQSCSLQEMLGDLRKLVPHYVVELDLTKDPEIDAFIFKVWADLEERELVVGSLLLYPGSKAGRKKLYAEMVAVQHAAEISMRLYKAKQLSKATGLGVQQQIYNGAWQYICRDVLAYQ